MALILSLASFLAGLLGLAEVAFSSWRQVSTAPFGGAFKGRFRRVSDCHGSFGKRRRKVIFSCKKEPRNFYSLVWSPETVPGPENK